MSTTLRFFTPAEWGMFEALEVLTLALIRRGADPHLLAEAFTQRAREVIQAGEAAGGDTDSILARVMPIHALATACATPSRWAAQPAPIANGGVVPFPVQGPLGSSCDQA
jgi:hypothetical protein